jgi:hypothetical protein
MVAAQFQRQTDVPERFAGCEKTTIGACERILCTEFAEETGEEVAASAGEITITGTLQSPLVLSPGRFDYDVPPNLDASALLFSGGESITVAAEGADVPAFQQTLTAPAATTLTSLAFRSVSGGLTTVVDASSDLGLSWTPAVAHEVHVLIQNLQPADLYDGLTCIVPAMATSVFVPASVLADWVGEPAVYLYIAQIASASQTVSPGNWSVEVRAITWLHLPLQTPAQQDWPAFRLRLNIQ